MGLPVGCIGELKCVLDAAARFGGISKYDHILHGVLLWLYYISGLDEFDDANWEMLRLVS